MRASRRAEALAWGSAVLGLAVYFLYSKDAAAWFFGFAVLQWFLSELIKSLEMMDERITKIEEHQPSQRWLDRTAERLEKLEEHYKP